MKESYSERLATDTGPESCGAARKGSAEALTGVRAGRVSSRESPFFGVSTLFREAEGITGYIDIARDSQTPRGLRPRARPETPRARTGRSVVRPK